jgi:hypothetical protein
MARPLQVALIGFLLQSCTAEGAVYSSHSDNRVIRIVKIFRILRVVRFLKLIKFVT